MTPTNQRKGLRIDVRIPVQIWLESRKVEGDILNLSEDGAYLKCEADWKVGQSVKVELEFRGKVMFAGRATSWEELRGKAVDSDAPFKLPTEMSTQTVIRWTLTDAPEEGARGFGVEFTDLDDQNREVLQKVIRYYENLRRAGVHFE